MVQFLFLNYDYVTFNHFQDTLLLMNPLMYGRV